MSIHLTFFTILVVACALVSAQLTGRVGPTTSTGAKRTKICNIIDYGGKIDSDDIGPAIIAAFECVKEHPGSTLYIPAGHYSMATWVHLAHGTKWAFQLDGIITRKSSGGGHMIYITQAKDFEFYSSTSAGGIQGNGYQDRNKGPRLLRIVNSDDWSLHDIILVDSPEFHIIIDGGTNGEIYNLAIRGASIGASDGIDIRGRNHWVHDVEVTNRDECVTVKSPSRNILIERIHCNQSAGCAIGSLGVSANVTDIVYRNIYTNGGDYFMLIKSNQGSGKLSNVLFQNFIGRGTAYGLDIDQYWEHGANSGQGVQLTNLTFQSWHGFIVDGSKRAAVKLICGNGAPCTDIVVDDVQISAANGPVHHSCQSAFGSGSCLRQGTPGAYQEQVVAVTLPRSFDANSLPTLPGDLHTGFSPDHPIPFPTIPTTFYPGLPQISPLAVNKKKDLKINFSTGST